MLIERYEISIWKKSAEVFPQVARLRRFNSRTDHFMKSFQSDKADATNESIMFQK